MELNAKQLELAGLAAAWLTALRHVPGCRVTEQQLTCALGVSRTPVRMIMPYLASKGFLAEGKHGYFIPEKMPELDSRAAAIPKSADQELFDTIILDRSNNRVPEQFSEAQFIRRYDVPRSQLTRVLIRLSLDGLVEPSTGQGWRFLPSLENERAYIDSYRFRVIIEPAGILERGFKQDDEKLRSLRAGHVKFSGVKSTDRQLFIELNSDFHETLARFSNNMFIIENVRKHSRLRRLSEHAFYDDVRMRTLMTEHIAIIDALLEGQREWASALMKRHLEIASKAVSFKKTP
ncbi:MAG: GntR family transcriptional regulator [Rhizobiales bacterium]|nr:GntR family transcriptional regulator [Hyphomicrobiales bacterium]